MLRRRDRLSHGLYVLEGQQRISFGDGCAESSAHLLGRKSGTNGDVSAGGAGELTVEAGVVERGGLLGRRVPLLVVGFVARADFGVGDHADHGHPGRRFLGAAYVHAFADGSFSGPAMIGHGLVNDRYQGRVGAVVLVEVAAFDQRDIHRPKVVAIDCAEHCELQLPGVFGLTFDGVGRHSRHVGGGERWW